MVLSMATLALLLAFAHITTIVLRQCWTYLLKLLLFMVFLFVYVVIMD